MDFSRLLLQWYSKHQRELPWRNCNNPYYVVVSEFMLQQTQVPRVVEKFKAFILLFPTLPDLANANKANVIKAWSGLGYNRRALLLHSFAQEVITKYNGEIPSVPEALIKLAGIGTYTAGSISSFAFNRPEPAIDVNVRRIYMRFFHGKDQGLPMDKKEEQKLYNLVKETIPENNSSDFHNALMDFGSLCCTRDTPQCQHCPLQKTCQFFPHYKSKGPQALYVMEKKVEQGVKENGKHIPHRIFRGRIVEYIRNNNNKEVSLSTIGKAIKKDFTINDSSWLLKLFCKLQEDKLITYTIDDQIIKLNLAH